MSELGDILLEKYEERELFTEEGMKILRAMNEYGLEVYIDFDASIGKATTSGYRLFSTKFADEAAQNEKVQELEKGEFPCAYIATYSSRQYGISVKFPTEHIAKKHALTETIFEVFADFVKLEKGRK